MFGWNKPRVGSGKSCYFGLLTCFIGNGIIHFTHQENVYVGQKKTAQPPYKGLRKANRHSHKCRPAPRGSKEIEKHLPCEQFHIAWSVQHEGVSEDRDQKQHNAHPQKPRYVGKLKCQIYVQSD